jgi:Uma2 family endonuclease
MIAPSIEKAEPVGLTRHRFTMSEYQRMAEVGLLTESDRVELIGGEIVEMSPINVTHVNCVNRLTAILSAKLSGLAIVSIQNPIQIDDYSVPQPDVALWKPNPDAYLDRLAGSNDILLIIEVADSSLDNDRRVKSQLYAQAGIADYWIVNLLQQQIEVYREPREDGYRTTTRYAPGETISLPTFPDVTLNVDEILGTGS